MRSDKNLSRYLGAAFLLQFITSFGSGVFLSQAWIVPDDIHQTLINVANNAGLVRINILVDVVTALGIIFLGAMLYLALRKQNETLALIGLGFYILEAGLLAASRTATFSLLHISQEYVATGSPEYLLTLGSLALEAMDFAGSTLHMLAFCPGGLLFYSLLYQSRIIPRWLSLWGLIALLPLAVGSVTALLGYDLPFVLFVPYVPFEFVVGLWILIKGIHETSETQASPLQPIGAH